MVALDSQGAGVWTSGVLPMNDNEQSPADNEHQEQRRKLFRPLREDDIPDDTDRDYELDRTRDHD